MRTLTVSILIIILLGILFFKSPNIQKDVKRKNQKIVKTENRKKVKHTLRIDPIVIDLSKTRFKPGEPFCTSNVNLKYWLVALPVLSTLLFRKSTDNNIRTFLSLLHEAKEFRMITIRAPFRESLYFVKNGVSAGFNLGQDSGGIFNYIIWGNAVRKLKILSKQKQGHFYLYINKKSPNQRINIAILVSKYLGLQPIVLPDGRTDKHIYYDKYVAAQNTVEYSTIVQVNCSHKK